MLKNQKGLRCIVVPIGLLVILVIAGIFAWIFISGTDYIRGLYAAKNFNLSFVGESDNSYQYQYSVRVSYHDSIDESGTCPSTSTLEGFRGKINIEYLSESEAKVEVLQNVKPNREQDAKPRRKQDGGILPTLCPAVGIQPDTETVRLDKKWIESGSADKNILVNDRFYRLELDKENRTISFKGEDYESTEPHLPDGLAQLYAYPMRENCMSVAQLQTYAKEHGIVTADDKYPGLAADIKAIPKLRLIAPDGSENVLLVIADDYVKQLVEKTQNELGARGACRVAAGKTNIHLW